MTNDERHMINALLYVNDLCMKIHHHRISNYRSGQQLFNTLYDDHPDVANAIRATEFDPFHYSDEAGDVMSPKLEACLDRIHDLLTAKMIAEGAGD